jgi:hypothetical protein
MGQNRLTLLTDKFFIFGLICLLTNDFILKYQFGGFVTGKLSDIAGLFIFPFFWSVFFARHKFKIYLLTVFIFAIWKTPVSTDLINWTNHALGTKFSRVIDYSDLVALVVLPISYRHLQRIETTTSIKSHYRPLPILISTISLFAFVATSLARQEIKKDLFIGQSYLIDLSKEEIFQNRMDAATGLCDSLEANMTDSLFYIQFRTGNHDLLTEVKIYSIDKSTTKLEFVSLTSYTVTGKLFRGFDEKDLKKREELKEAEYLELFNVGVVETIKTKDKFESDIYYWNPKLDPRILEEN